MADSLTAKTNAINHGRFKMKLRTTKAEVKKYYHRILSIGYCDAQYLLKYLKPFAYSKGSYGWSCDYYDIDGVCICTGYSPLANKNMKNDYKLIREYEEKASKVDNVGSYEIRKMGNDGLLKQLIEKLTIKETVSI